MWRDWFNFTQQDRRGILLLSILIVIALLLLWTKPMWHQEKDYEAYTPDSLVLSPTGKQQEEPFIRIAPHPFNPNTADSIELLTVGLPPRVARNILRYRQAGGVFRKADDLARIYGMHDTLYVRIKPYVEIPAMDQSVAKPPRIVVPYETVHHEYSYAEKRQVKYKPGQFVDPNIADTTELMKIPGIGTVRAQRIIEYRRALGGFHTIKQLHEACDLPEHLGDWVHISTPTIEKLHINKASLSQLKNHPYLTFYQARAIVELRKREGDIRSMRQLLFLDEFTEDDIARLTPYLSFE